MEMSPETDKLFAALAKAQGAMKGALKDSSNPFFKSKYADLASCWEVCRKPLADNGLAVIQSPNAAGNVVTVTTMLVHETGQWVRNTLSMSCHDDTPQSIGSGTTYARRYSLSALVGIAPEDDDANAAQPQERKMAPLGERPSKWAKAMPKGPAVSKDGQPLDTAPLEEPLDGDSIPFAWLIALVIPALSFLS